MSRYTFIESPDFNESMKFGEIIRKKRRLMGLSQSELGELLDADQGTISKWELGLTSPAIESARYMLRILGFELVIKDKRHDF